MRQGSAGFRLAVIAVVAVLGAAPASAQFDLNGGWQVTVSSGGMVNFDFTQSGTVLTATAVGLTWEGTIDPGTGVFSIHATDASVAMVMACGVIDATITPDGDHFSGSFETAPLQCVGLHPPVCQCGTFTSQSVVGARCAGPCPVCGNGVVESGEQCDDGNGFGGDCCSPSCQFDSAGTQCTSDSNACTTDQCDGAGTCEHLANVLSCGSICQPAACAAGVCVPQAPAAAGTACASDAEPCTADACDGAGQCGHGPLSGCRAAARAAIALRTGSSGGRLRWGWKDDSGLTTLADFGVPTGSTAYRLCLFADQSLLFAGGAPAGSGWVARNNGFAFKSKGSVPDGIGALRLRAAGNKSKLITKGSGPLVTFSAPLDLPAVRAQLLAADAGTRCWEAEFDQPTVHTATQFTAHE